MATAEIIKPIPADKKDDMTDIVYDKHTVRKNFRAKIVALQQKYLEEHKPFCYPCAKRDYEAQQELKWTTGKKGRADLLVNVEVDFDLEPYTKASRFKLIKETDIKEPKLVDGIRIEAHTGVWKEYQCKVRGCKHSIQVHNEVKK